MEVKLHLVETDDGLLFPLVLLGYQEKKLTFLLDTGASHSTIREDVYEYFKETLTDTGKAGSLMGIDGTSQKQLPIVKMEFTFGKQKYTDDFWVTDSPTFEIIEKENGLQLHGLLGLPFLLKIGCSIDLAQSVIRINEVA